MNHALVGGIINELPIEKMVAAPLLATIKAQSDMSMALAHYVENVGLDTDGNVRMVTFNYSEAAGEETEDRHIEAPFVALTGIPNLAVEDVNISFDLAVNTAETNVDNSSANANVTADTKAWWSPVTTKFTGSVTHSSSQTRRTDTRAKYSFNVNARKQETPEAFMRIVDAITNSVANPMLGKKNEKNLLPSEGSNEGTNPPSDTK